MCVFNLHSCLYLSTCPIWKWRDYSYRKTAYILPFYNRWPLIITKAILAGSLTLDPWHPGGLYRPSHHWQMVGLDGVASLPTTGTRYSGKMKKKCTWNPVTRALHCDGKSSSCFSDQNHLPIGASTPVPLTILQQSSHFSFLWNWRNTIQAIGTEWNEWFYWEPGSDGSRMEHCIPFISFFSSAAWSDPWVVEDSSYFLRRSLNPNLPIDTLHSTKHHLPFSYSLSLSTAGVPQSSGTLNFLAHEPGLDSLLHRETILP